MCLATISWSITPSRAPSVVWSALLHVEGPPNPEIFDGKVDPGSGH